MKKRGECDRPVVKSQTMRIKLKIIQTLDLVDKNLKAAFKTMLKMNKQTENLSRRSRKKMTILELKGIKIKNSMDGLKSRLELRQGSENIENKLFNLNPPSGAMQKL